MTISAIQSDTTGLAPRQGYRGARHECLAAAITLGACVAVAGLVAGGWFLMRGAQKELLRDTTFDNLPAVAGPVLDVDRAQVGRAVYASTCQSCHGPKGRGIPGLGKDLVTSTFCRTLSDAHLLEFVKTGRPIDDPRNTTGVLMPPRGGNPGLSDAQLADAVEYLRGLQNPQRMPRLGPPTEAHIMAALPAEPEPAPGAAPAPDMSADEDYSQEELASGKKWYLMSCVSCHGPDALGLPKLGKDLVHSTFLADLDDDQAVDFLKKGRSTSDPLNTTKVDMPPKGGNPALNDDRLYDIVAYLRFLHKHAKPS